MTNILLIDLNSIAHPLFHVSASDPNPNATSIKTVERVRALASGQPHVAVCCDSGRSFRRDISPDYKANRPPTDATLQHQITLAMETLADDGFPVWAVKGFEADDLIATAVTHALALKDTEESADSVIIASADKDLLQLISDRVQVKSLRDGSLLDEDAVFAKFGVKPHQVRDYLALVGDASDNVKGANGIGEKTAAALLSAFGNLDDMYAALDKGDAAMKPGTVKALTEFRPRMEMTRSLIALRTDVPIPFDEVFKERVPKDVAVFDGGGLIEHEGHAADGDAGGTPRTETIPSTGAASLQDETSRRNARIEQPSVPAPGGTEVGVETQKPRAGSEPADSRHIFSTEILPPPSTDFSMQLEPRSLRESALLAQELFKSRLFSAYGTYQGVLSTILAGRELGLQAMASLRGFHIIDGKPTLSADLIRALVLKSGACDYFRCVTRTNDGATWETQRKGQAPQTLSFTLDDGKLAWSKDEKAWKASGWGKNPADMCVARASAKLCRLVYADVCFNLCAPEEME